MSDFGWIPVEVRLPKDFDEVIITWGITNIEQYDGDTEDKKFSGVAIFYKSKWYWYSNATLYELLTYGKCEDRQIDDAIKITAWMPLPEPYRSYTGAIQEENEDDHTD